MKEFKYVITDPEGNSRKTGRDSCKTGSWISEHCKNCQRREVS